MARRKIRASHDQGLILHPNPSEVRSTQESRYQSALGSQALLSEQIRAFQGDDRPAYENWVQSNFSKLLLKGFERSTYLEDLETQLHAILMHSDTYGVSLSKSARIIFKEREKGEVALESFFEDIRTERASQEEQRQSQPGQRPSKIWKGEDGEEEIEDLFEESFERSSHYSSKNSAETPSDEYYKTIYRDCVRLIHPDVKGPDAFDEDLWNELQTAHAHRDYARLESLRARITQGGVTEYPLSSGDITTLRVLVEKKIRELKSVLSDLKRDPAWQFGQKSKNPKHMKKLSGELRMVLMLDLRDIDERIEALQFELDQFRPKKPNQKRAKNPAASSPTRRRPR